MELEKIKNFVGGEVRTDESSLAKNSRDASIFEVEPSVVVKPRDVEDLKKLVKFVAETTETQKESEYRNSDQDTSGSKIELSLTARAGGTDMSGGPLNDSIIVDFGNFNKIMEVNDESCDIAGRKIADRKIEGWAVTEPGVYYRDFEKATLAKGLLLPSYPASREICMVGGMVANNAGGEKSLAYGKTDKYVEELQVVLSDGEEYTLRPLTLDELEQKKLQNNFEGTVYTRIHELIEANYERIQNARPKVSKNSAGYALWDVWDKKVFDLTKLFCGSQGTLGFVTKIKFLLIKPHKFSKLLVIFLKDIKPLGEIVGAAIRYGPESFESFDKHTLKLAVRFLPGLVKSMKDNFLSFALRFLPEIWLVISRGVPELVLLAEFTGDDEAVLKNKIEDVRKKLQQKFRIQTRIAKNQADTQKYWTMRRESFNLLRKHVGGKKAAPFIDDLIVTPDKLPEFLPKLNEILVAYEKQMVYSIAGHAGDGNFHVIPLMNLSDPAAGKTIQDVAEKVYNLVLEYGGSITAEHNDGLIRTPYLEKMYGPEMVRLFEETKKIFDPQNIFNPRKKVGGNMEWAMKHIAKQ